ncbi:MAG TPA: glycosyltransferase family 39 protein [Methylococcaceae bacterium]|nr:glycosyltransferase family 39 protein [Methylococcaceae bacterium]
MDNHLSRPPPALTALTFALVLAVLFLALGENPLLSFNEARRAVPAREMLESGDWLLPRLNGELYLRKPPLLYWLIAGLGSVAGGVGEWVARLPSALAALAAIGLCYRHALRVFGPWPALFTMQILIANAGFAVFARRAEIEMLLASLCTVALLLLLRFVRDGGRGFLLGGYFLMGLAFLAKGPLALLFVTAPLLVHAWRSRAPRAWAALATPSGWILFLAVGLSWYAVVAGRLGWGVWADVIQSDMIGKIQGRSGGRDPLYDYPLWLFGDFLPFGLLLLAGPVATVRGWWARADTAVLLYAVVIPLAAFSLSGDKHAKYLLPAYPALALLLGQRLGELYGRASPLMRRGILMLGVLMPVGYGGYFSFGEGKLYASRIAALPQIGAVFERYPGIPALAVGEVDERVIFYAGRTLRPASTAEVRNALATTPDLLVFGEKPEPVMAEVPGLCKVRELAPFLKKGKKAAILGAGRPCLGRDVSLPKE